MNQETIESMVELHKCIQTILNKYHPTDAANSLVALLKGYVDLQNPTAKKALVLQISDMLLQEE